MIRMLLMMQKTCVTSSTVWLNNMVPKKESFLGSRKIFSINLDPKPNTQNPEPSIPELCIVTNRNYAGLVALCRGYFDRQGWGGILTGVIVPDAVPNN